MTEFESPDLAEEKTPGLPLGAPRLLAEPRKCSPAYGWRWMKEAFALFRKSPLMWLGFLVAYIVISMTVSQIPVLSICIYVIGPVFMAGIVRSCYVLDKSNELEFSLLFAGFSRSLWSLVLIGLSYIAILLLGSIALVVPVYFLFGGVDPLLITLMIMIVSGFAVATIWFAPALVVLNGFSSLNAMKNSVLACLRNVLPLLVFSIIAFLMLIPVMFCVALMVVALTVVASTTDFLSTYFTQFILGWFSKGGHVFSLSELLQDPQFILATVMLAIPPLIWMQMLLLSQYSAYRDIFLASDLD